MSLHAPPASLDAKIAALQARLTALQAAREAASSSSPCLSPATSGVQPAALRHDAPGRYSRQMLVPAFGPAAQRELSTMTVLIVGAGGLGCPAALYLAAAGVRRLLLMDDDVVDASNLHRQVAHTEAAAVAKVPKVVSLAASLQALNSRLEVTPLHGRFGGDEASWAAVKACDVVLDASDNPATRYMINDACVLAGKPLVSGAALGTDGQASVYAWDAGAPLGKRDGSGGDTAPTAFRAPCYRCIHPSPPAPGSVTSCADGGVLGPVTGVIGSFQALEVLKIAATRAAWRAQHEEEEEKGEKKEGSGSPLWQQVPCGADASTAAAIAAAASAQYRAGSATLGASLAGRLLVLDGADARIRTVALRGPRDACAVCGAAPTIRSLADSEAWCKAAGLVAVEGGSAAAPPCATGACGLPVAPQPHVLPQLSPSALKGASSSSLVVLDVRSALQYGIAHLPGSHSLPLAVLRAAPAAWVAHLRDTSITPPGVPVAVLCRRGIDSSTATALLREAGLIEAANVTGGLTAYARDVDPTFAMY